MLSTTWLLERNDGRAFMYTVGFRDPDLAIDMTAAIDAVVAGRDLLATVG